MSKWDEMRIGDLNSVMLPFVTLATSYAIASSSGVVGLPRSSKVHDVHA